MLTTGMNTSYDAASPVVRALVDLRIANGYGGAYTIAGDRYLVNSNFAKFITDHGGSLRYLRLRLEPNGGVTVEDFSIDSNLVVKTYDHIPGSIESWYPSLEALPKHLYEKLAVLLVCDPNVYPTPDIEGVGRRISLNTFWLYI